jgi:hypothetical protein
MGFGNWSALTKKHTDEIGQLVVENRSREAVVGRAVTILRKVADSKEANNNIGKQIYEIFIPHDPKESPIGRYHTGVPTNEIWQPPLINIAGEKPKVLPELIYTATPKTSNQGAWEVPKVKMNALCPCGTGKKYKFCHGQSQRSTATIKI